MFYPIALAVVLICYLSLLVGVWTAKNYQASTRVTTSIIISICTAPLVLILLVAWGWSKA